MPDLNIDNLQLEIEASSADAVESIDRLSASLKRLNKSMSSMSGDISGIKNIKSDLRLFDSFGNSLKLISNTFKLIGNGSVGAIKSIASLSARIKELTGNTKSVNNLNFSFGQLLKTLVGFHSITGVANFAKETLTMGGDLTEVNHIVESVYGDMSDSVKQWADTMLDRYGIASLEAKKYAGTLTAMSKAAGIATEDATQIGIGLTEAAGDISAFFNIDTEEAYKKLQSGLAGQVRPLRQLGIDLQATTLKQYALDQGIEKSYADMTQAEKIMLRYDYIMKVLSSDYEKGIGVLGDYSRTSESYANALRKLSAYISAIKTEIGSGFTAMLRPTIVAINTLMKGLLNAAKAFAVFMKTLFPFQNGTSGLALEDSAEYADDLADGAESAADGLGSASDAAKQLKKDLSVLPFDELNQLNKDREVTSSANGGGVGSVGSIGDLGTEGLYDWDGLFDGLKETKIPDAINEWAQKIRDSFINHDWKGLGENVAGLINVGLEKIHALFDRQKARDKIYPYVDAITTTINSLNDNINWELLGTDIGDGINIIVDAFDRLIDPKTGINWGNIGKSLARGANGLVEAIDFEKLGGLFAKKFNIFWQVASNFATTFNWKKLGSQLAKGANGFVTNIDYNAIATTFREGINGIVDAVNAFLDDFEAYNFGESLGNAFMTVANGVNWQKIGTTLAKVWNKAWEFLKGFVSRLGKNDVGFVEGMYNFPTISDSDVASVLNGKGTGLGKAISDLIDGAISSVNVKDMSKSIGTLVKKVAEDISVAFGDPEKWFKIGHMIGKALGGILSTKGLGEEAANAVNAITTGLVSLFDGAIDGLDSESEGIRQNLEDFLTGLNWTSILQITGAFVVGKLVGLLPTIIGVSVLKNALTKEIVKVFGAVASSGEATVAGGTIFTPIISSLGAVGVAGTLIGATAVAIVKLQELSELLHGGNGMISEEGSAFDEFIQSLSEMHTISSKTHDELYNLKEEWESSGYENENAFYLRFAQTLSEAGVNGELAKNVIERLKTSLGLTTKQADLLGKAVEGVGTTSTGTGEILDGVGTTTEEAIGKIMTAIQEAGLTAQTEGQAILSETFPEIQRAFQEATGSGDDLGRALNDIITDFSLTETQVGYLRQAINAQLGGDVFDDLITATDNTKTSMSNLKDETKTTADEARTAWNESKKAQITALQDADSQIEASKQLSTGAMLEEKLAMKEWEKQSKASSDNYGTNVSTAISNAKTEIKNAALEEDLKASVADAVSKSKEDVEQSGYKSGENVLVGLARGLQDTTELNSVKEASETAGEDYVIKPLNDALGVASPSTKTYSSAQDVLQGFINGLRDHVGEVLDYIRTSVSGEISEQLKSDFGDIATNISDSASSIMNGITSGLSSGEYELEDEVSSITSIVKSISSETSGMYNTMYDAGQDIVTGLQNGLNSIHLQLPHIADTGNFKRMWTGPNSWWDIPTYTVRWYAKGGLFTKATLAGFGEAGNEAAIPLENKRVMRMIGSSVADNMGDTNNDNLVDAITQGYVRAMMANSGNERQPIINVICKTENDEVLFRAVQRGRESVEYRNRPIATY